MVSLFTCYSCRKEKASNTTNQIHDTQLKKLNASGITGDYGTYVITNVLSNMALDVSGITKQGAKLKNSATLVQYPLSGEKWQDWNIIKLSNGYYKIMNLNSGKVLDVPYGSSTQGLQLHQFQWLGNDNQQWQINSLGGGAYSILNKGNGLVLTNEGNSTSANTNITQRTWANNNSQKWNLNSKALNSYRDDEVTRFFRRTSGSTAFDGVTSTQLTYGNNNGRTLWTTNDTWFQGQGSNIGPDGLEACHGSNQPLAYSRTALLQPAPTAGAFDWNPGNTGNILTNHGLKILPNYKSDPQEWIWPSGVTEVGSHIYMYADEGNYNSLAAASVAIYDINQSNNSWGGVNYTATRIANTELDNWNFTSSLKAYSRWMNGMVKQSVGGINYIYIYGFKTANSNAVCVARFPETSPGTWQFFNGSGWSNSVTAAQPIMSAAGGSFFVSKVNGKFVFIGMDFGFGCDAGKSIYSAISNSPTGGFSTLKKVYEIADYKQGHMPVHYAIGIHPQFPNPYDSGNNAYKELLITYCVNEYDGCLPLCNTGGKLDPDDYRPRGVRIPWALIGI